MFEQHSQQDTQTRVTSVIPEYEPGVLDGYFNITFDKTRDTVFRLSFSAFLKHRFTQDVKLKQYIRKIDKDDIFTASTIVAHLYDIGLPMEEWVCEYMEVVKARISTFDTLIKLVHFIKTFGDDECA